MKKIFPYVLGFIIAGSLTAFGQIVSTASGNWSDAATWTGGVVPGPNDDVVIADNDTVIIDAQSVSIKNLTVGQGNPASLRFNSSAAVVVTVSGSITISANGEFKVLTNTISSPGLVDTLYLYGDLTNNGTMDFRTGSAGSTLAVCDLVLTGATNSTLTTPVKYQSQGDFNKLFINKSNKAKVILGSDIFVNGGSSTAPLAQSGIVFINGIVETGNYALVYVGTTEANISGYSDSSYVVGAMGRGISNSGPSSKNFPVGDSKSFEIISVHGTSSGGSTGHYALVRCISGDANTGSSTLNGGIDKVSQVRYYRVGYHVVNGVNTPPAALNMGYDYFKVSYNSDDGVNGGNTDLRLAVSTDSRATWTAFPQNYEYTTKSDTLPRQLIDTLASAVTVNNGEDPIYLALARLSGTTSNDLGTPTAVEGKDNLKPLTYSLSQSYPNPFNPSATISFSIPKPGYVKLSVYNILGKEVASLVDGYVNAGEQQVSFNAAGLASGVYLYTVRAGSYSKTMKMILMK